MSEEVEGLVIQYNVTDGAIAEIAEKFKDADADTPDGYRNVVVGIRTTRELRGEVEARRKELKQDALVYGRKVDGEARRITNALLEVETPLKLLKSTVDDEKARVKRDMEKLRLDLEREKLEKERAEKEAEEKKVREAEEKRLEEERKVLAAERKKFIEEQEIQAAQDNDAKQLRDREEHARLRRIEAEDKARREKRLAEDRERAEKQEAEAEKQRAEAKDIEHRRRELEALEQERQAREKAEKEAEQKRLAEERHKTEMAELEKRRVTALPDVEKLKAYTDQLLDLEPPHIASPSGIAVKGQIDRKLLECQALVTEFAEELES